MHATSETFPLIAELLAEQQRLDTPVARFSAAQDRQVARSYVPPGIAAPARHPTGWPNSQLIPLTTPGPGEQYNFEVDLDACTGCKSCVAACHALNGLDDEETWRDVGLLVGTDRRHPFAQTITTACHHCGDPACLNGCPVLAYEKDPITGIVRHLDDQCIGCSYCVLQCPYDVPKYSKRLGIVRKCDMCHGRLAHGEPPACAQACPTAAIRITVTTRAANEEAATYAADRSEEARPSIAAIRPPDHEAAPRAKRSVAIPGLASPTRPTTRYVSARRIPAEVIAADHAALRPQPAHWPLVFLLLLMPMAIGCGIADEVLSPHAASLAVTSWVSGVAGLVFSVAHLGQPRRAWRVFLGLRRSWLSREAIVFGAWLPLSTTTTAAQLHWIALSPFAMQSVAGLTAIVGVTGLGCSVMIYANTRRAFWRTKHTGPRFFGSAVVLGLACSLAYAAGDDASVQARCAIALIAAIVAKLLFEAHALEPLKGDRNEVTPELTTARLLTGPLRSINEWRAATALSGGVILPMLIGAHLAPASLAWPALALVATGELLERSLFFRAVDAPKMPGVPR